MPDGDVADFAIVAARTGDGERGVSLFLVDLTGPGVTRKTGGDHRPHPQPRRLSSQDAPAEPLGAAGRGLARSPPRCSTAPPC